MSTTAADIHTVWPATRSRSRRIAAIADVYDALTSDRVYRPAMSVPQALAILEDGHGTHFDPVLLDTFLSRR